jgi:hypothetical protein
MSRLCQHSIDIRQVPGFYLVNHYANAISLKIGEGGDTLIERD